jgi:hypothetical protein
MASSLCTSTPTCRLLLSRWACCPSRPRGSGNMFPRGEGRRAASVHLHSAHLYEQCTRLSITPIIRQQNDLPGGLCPVYRIRERGVNTAVATNAPKHGGLAAYISIIAISHGLRVTDYCMACLMQGPRTPCCPHSMALDCLPCARPCSYNSPIISILLLRGKLHCSAHSRSALAHGTSASDGQEE